MQIDRCLQERSVTSIFTTVASAGAVLMAGLVHGEACLHEIGIGIRGARHQGQSGHHHVRAGAKRPLEALSQPTSAAPYPPFAVQAIKAQRGAILINPNAAMWPVAGPLAPAGGCSMLCKRVKPRGGHAVTRLPEAEP